MNNEYATCCIMYIVCFTSMSIQHYQQNIAYKISLPIVEILWSCEVDNAAPE